MNNVLNYGELEAMLGQRGFQSVQASGPQRVFENTAFDVLIVLPPLSTTDTARQHHLATVRKMVIETGIADGEVLDRLLAGGSLAKA
jgi:hypothetical protein